MDDDNDQLYVVAEGTVADPLRQVALEQSVALAAGYMRRLERLVDDDEVEEILIVAERLHNWLRAEPGMEDRTVDGIVDDVQLRLGNGVIATNFLFHHARVADHRAQPGRRVEAPFHREPVMAARR